MTSASVEPSVPNQSGPLRVLARYWVLVLLLVIVGGAAGAGYSYSRPDVVTAEARVGVGSGALSAYQVPGFAQASSDLAANYARYVSRAQFQAPLVEALGASAAGRVLSVNASPIPSANVLRIEVTADDPTVSARAAQAVALALIAQVKATAGPETAAAVLTQYNALAGRVATADAARQRAETAFAKARNVAGASPVGSVTGATQAPVSDAQRAADQAQAVQVAATQQVATLTLQRDALKQKYSDLINAPATQSGLRLVSAGTDTSHSRNSSLQRYGLAGVIAGVLLALVLGTALDRRRERRQSRVDDAALVRGRHDTGPPVATQDPQTR